MNIEITQEIRALSPTSEWRPLAPPARSLAMAVSSITAFLITLVATSAFVLAANDSSGLYFLIALALAGAMASLAAFIAAKRWRNTFWKLDDEALRVRRGKTWFKEICLPRSRVQHLDFERGPLERKYGLATLIVHTAGSQSHALRQSGLALADAEYLRDLLMPKNDRKDV